MAALKLIIILSLSWIAAVRAGVEEEGLAEHNRLRDLHGVPHLKLSDELNAKSKAYAEVLAKKQTLEHSDSNGKYSENLCFRSHNPEKCTQDWYDEIKDYDFDNPGFSLKTGHFTALIWAASTEMGYGQATAENGHHYVVAMYVPAGNVIGKFNKEVPSPVKDKSESSRISPSINVMIILICFGLFKLTY